MGDKFTRRDVMGGAVAIATVTVLGTRPALADVTHHEVLIRRLKFKPDHILVKVGDIIRWTNKDLAPHTATATEFGWDTGEIAKGDSYEVTVTEGMETNYFCAFHPHMKGSFEIQGA